MKKVLFAVSVAMATLCVRAQSDTLYPIIDDTITNHRFTTGFLIGYNRSQFYLDPSAGSSMLFTEGDGMRLGLLASWKINDYFAVTPRADLVLSNAKVNVTDEEGIVYETPILPARLEFMAHFQVGLPLKNGSKPYLILGPNYRLPVKSEDLPQRNYGSKTDFGADIGIGFEFPIRDFLVSPEIRYTRGFTDINKNPFLPAMYHNQFAFVLSFKG